MFVGLPGPDQSTGWGDDNLRFGSNTGWRVRPTVKAAQHQWPPTRRGVSRPPIAEDTLGFASAIPG